MKPLPMLLRKLLNVICRKNRLCMWSRLFFYSAEEWKGDNMELSKQLYREISSGITFSWFASADKFFCFFNFSLSTVHNAIIFIKFPPFPTTYYWLSKYRLSVGSTLKKSYVTFPIKIFWQILSYCVFIVLNQLI